MALSLAINAALMRLTEAQPETGYQELLTEETLEREHNRTMYLTRRQYVVVGQPCLLPTPMWAGLLARDPYNNKIGGRWLLVVALDLLDLLQNTDNMFWALLQTPEVQVIGHFTEIDEFCLSFLVPKNTTLTAETCFFMRHYVSQHIDYVPAWPQEATFDLLDASHDLQDMLESTTSIVVKNGLELTAVQRNTVAWLRLRLDLEGTLEPMFVAFGPRNKRLYYCDELRFVTTTREPWHNRVVLLADSAAGKDTAVLVYLSHLPMLRNMLMIVCADQSTVRQWRRKLAAHALTAFVFTYAEIANSDFVLPRVHVLLLDSVIDFRHAIFTHLDYRNYSRVILLTPYLPTLSMAWRLLSPTRDPYATLWMRGMHGLFVNELWSACVLTHVQVLEQSHFEWTTRKLPMLQPLLYRKWQQENIAFLAQLFHAEDKNPLNALRIMFRRMQQGLLGVVDASEVHYACVQSTVVQCSICLAECAILPVRTACAHTFCYVCMQQWQSRNPSCPLCRQNVLRVNMEPVHSRMFIKPRIPFVQKQTALRTLIMHVPKVIVISRFDSVLRALSRTWNKHPVYYGVLDTDNFDMSARGVWFLPITMLNCNMDLTCCVDMMVFLEEYPAEHYFVQMANRMFTFAPVIPECVMLTCDVDVEKIMPENASMAEMVAVLVDK